MIVGSGVAGFGVTILIFCQMRILSGYVMCTAPLFVCFYHVLLRSGSRWTATFDSKEAPSRLPSHQISGTQKCKEQSAATCPFLSEVELQNLFVECDEVRSAQSGISYPVCESSFTVMPQSWGLDDILD